VTELEMQFVKHVDDPVWCPKCRKPMFKKDSPYPSRPVPVRTGTFSRPGSAYCDNSKCEYARKQEFVSWVVEYSSVG